MIKIVLAKATNRDTQTDGQILSKLCNIVMMDEITVITNF